MIKITKATHLDDFVIELEFSDGTRGEYDLRDTLQRPSPLTESLRDVQEFKKFFLDLGALCWPNGLELSPSAIHQKLEKAGKLQQRVA